MFELPDFSQIVDEAIAEDLGVTTADLVSMASAGDGSLLALDVTSAAVIPEDSRFVGRIVARQECVVCGLPVAAEVFERFCALAGLFEPVDFFPLVAEGSRVVAGTPVAEVDGLASAALTCERTALNFLMLLSGIATETAAWVELAGDVAVCDTRKTVPGMRALSKYAVRVGGGTNHRSGLFDMILIKDNHIRRAGGLGAAIRAARAAKPELTIEAEAETVEQALEAVRAGADIVMLDNMASSTLAAAVTACREAASELGASVSLEVSGGLTAERLGELSSAGIDRMSSSALTFARPVDFGLDETGGDGA